ncbi:hypothetical protein I7I48_09415 [Histoplasma ohiense]|nr:hypothetical protein I7I48_09415 [Histoplasma ohiense (nom. inval.)]
MESCRRQSADNIITIFLLFSVECGCSLYVFQGSLTSGRERVCRTRTTSGRWIYTSDRIETILKYLE